MTNSDKPRRVADYERLPEWIPLTVRRPDTGEVLRMEIRMLKLWETLVEHGYTIVPLDEAPAVGNE